MNASASGAMAEAPVAATLTRSRPIFARSLLSTSRSASACCTLSASGIELLVGLAARDLGAGLDGPLGELALPLVRLGRERRLDAGLDLVPNRGHGAEVRRSDAGQRRDQLPGVVDGVIWMP